MHASTASARVRWIGWSLLSAALACGGGTSQETDACVAGAAGCPCAQDDVCADGLVCVDSECADTDTSGGTSGVSGSPSTGGGGGSSGVGDSTLELTGYDATLGCEFVCPEDTPAFVCGGLPSSCDPFHQDCPYGQKCFAYDEDGDGALDDAYCAALVGDAVEGESCVVDQRGHACFDSCARGLRCWHVDPESGEGTCAALCEGDLEAPSCADVDDGCLLLDDGPLNVCVPRCDPLAQDCEAGEQCVGAPAGPGWICVPSASSGMAPVGTPCASIDGCEPGLTCVDVERFPAPDCGPSPGCCAAFCALDDGDADCVELPISELGCAPYDPDDERPQDVGLCLPAP